jgi:hypothetical protein
VFGGLGGVGVVVDRPQLELGDRQSIHLLTATLAHRIRWLWSCTCCATTILAPLCRCAVQKFRR